MITSDTFFFFFLVLKFCLSKFGQIQISPRKTRYFRVLLPGCQVCLHILMSCSPRVLKVFLSRTAQRIPYMTGGRVMRMLAVIVLVVFWFLVGWTSSVCQNLERHISLIGQGRTSDHLIFSMCLVERWDYMTAAGTWSLGLCGCLLFAHQHDNGLPQKPCQTLTQTLEEFYPFGFGKTIL